MRKIIAIIIVGFFVQSCTHTSEKKTHTKTTTVTVGEKNNETPPIGPPLAHTIYVSKLLSQDREEDALKYINDQIDDSDKPISIYHISRAKVYKKLGANELCEKELLLAIKIGTKYVEAYSLLSSLYLDHGMKEEAGKILFEGYKIDSSDFVINLEIGRTNILYGEYELALKYTKKAESIGNDKDRSAILINLAIIHDGLNNRDSAIYYYNSTIRQYPNKYADAYGNLALMYINDDLDKSYKLLLKAVEVDPENARIFNNLIWSRYLAKDFNEGILLGEKGLKDFPENGDIPLNLALIYIEIDDFDKACNLLPITDDTESDVYKLRKEAGCNN